ncbi:MAG TPA: response regulator transcription factor [Gaiellaceae bacterium]|jgi:DNA-binding NarL/FixJ family response regulator
MERSTSNASQPSARSNSAQEKERSNAVREEVIRTTITCLVADDHPAVARAVSDVLRESGIQIAGQVCDGKEALEAIRRKQPNVALLDINMPLLSGIEVARRCARVAPKTGIILYTGYSEQALLADALDAGVRGFVSKDAPLTEIVRAVRLIAEGRAYVDSVLAGVISDSTASGKVSRLTQRERDILRMLAGGHSTAAIGKALFISPATVRSLVRKMLVKLDAETRTEAVAIALRESIIA